MVFGRKVFGLNPERDIYAAFRCPHIATGLLQHAIGLRSRKWVVK